MDVLFLYQSCQKFIKIGKDIVYTKQHPKTGHRYGFYTLAFKIQVCHRLNESYLCDSLRKQKPTWEILIT